MKKTSKKFALTLAAASVALSCVVGVAQASGHFVVGLQGQYPAYDLNDTYVFESSEDGYTSFISSSNPSQPGSAASPAGIVFASGGLYNLHIAQDGTFESGMTLVFSFDKDSVDVHSVSTANADVGDKGELLGSGKVGGTLKLENGIRVWTGRGEETFFGNGIGLSKFNAAKQSGQFKPEIFKEDGDLFLGSTASFIVVDVPNALLSEEIKFFTTTAVTHKDEWKQVDRHANVLFPYVFLSDTPAVQEDHEQHRPDLDVKERRQAIVNNVFWAVSASKAAESEAVQYANEIADKMMPDVLTYRPGTQAAYTVENLNGRALHDDAMNTALQLMTRVAIDDNADDSQRYTSEFPYIIAAE